LSSRAFDSDSPARPAVTAPALDTAMHPVASTTHAEIRSRRIDTHRWVVSWACLATDHCRRLAASSSAKRRGMPSRALMTASPERLSENWAYTGALLSSTKRVRVVAVAE
jgi:fructose/tagatose bisphosphate aldolase